MVLKRLLIIGTCTAICVVLIFLQSTEHLHSSEGLRDPIGPTTVVHYSVEGGNQPNSSPISDLAGDSVVLETEEAKGVSVTDEASGTTGDHRDDRQADIFRLEDLRMPNSPAIDRLMQRFVSEGVDPVWSTSTESEIHNQIALLARNIGLIDIQVECRTTLCRVQLVYAGATQSERTGDVSIRAAIFGSILNRKISGTLDLNGVLFNSGYNGYGTPMSLVYLERTGALATQNEQ